MRKELVLIILTFTVFTSNLIAEEFKSKYNFKFNLPDGYQIFNNVNLFQVYDHSNKDPILKKKLNLVKETLEKQDIELLYNFSSSPINNITILVFNNNYKVSEKKVLKQC